MKRCPGEREGVTCAHGEIKQPLRMVWGAVLTDLGDAETLRRWEAGDYESWARRALLLPLGYRWTSDEILWHAQVEAEAEGGTVARGRAARGRGGWVVVVSRAVAPEPAASGATEAA